MAKPGANDLAKKIRCLWVSEYRDFELRTKGKSTDWGSRHMNRWDGGDSADGKFYKAVWPKIATFVEEHELDAELLVRAMFYRCLNYAPMPNQAHGGTALERYRIYTSPTTQVEMKTELMYSFESQKSRALREVFSKKTYYKLDETTAWRVTIGDPVVPFTPLFRYCVAVNQGWDDIGTAFEGKAKRQYKQFAELYNEVWTDWIPASLRAIGTTGAKV